MKNHNRKTFTKPMMVVTSLLTSFSLLVGCTQQTTAPAAPQQTTEASKPAANAATPESTETGATASSSEAEKVYLDTCGGCHGQTRLGALGPALLPERIGNTPDEDLIKTITEGRPGTSMKSYKDELSPDVIKGLVEYIKTPVDESKMKWTLEDAKNSMTVIADEKSLPDKPKYDIDVKEVMVAMERETRKYFVMDGKNHKALGHIEGSYRTHAISYNPKNPRYMYGIGRDGWLFKADLYNIQAVRKTRVGLDSRGVAVSDDGKWVAVTNYLPGGIAILNADTLEPVKIIPTYGVDPDGKMVHSRGAALFDTPAAPYFIVALKEAGRVWMIDWSAKDKDGNNTFPIVADIPNVGRILHDAFETPKGDYFFIASQSDNHIAVIDVLNKKLVKKIPAGKKPHPGPGATWATKDGRILAATPAIGQGLITIWDTKTFEVVKQIKTDGPGLFIRSHPNSQYVWADVVFKNQDGSDFRDEVVVFDKDTLELVTKGAAKNGVIHAGPVSVHPEFNFDGSAVYVSLWEGEAVKVYDAKTLEEKTTITGTKTPTGIFNVGLRIEEPGA